MAVVWVPPDVDAWCRVGKNGMYACSPARRTFIQRPVTVGKFEKLGEVYTTTEDGSMGEKGYVTQHSVLHTDRFDMIYTCGPKPMMVSVAKYAKAHGIECEVSLENRMACGVGACLCCVENTDEGHLCVCKEGPVFNIKKLLWQI